MRAPLAAAYVSVVMALPLMAPADAHADASAVPPWVEPGDIPLPTWAKSVSQKHGPDAREVVVFPAPGKIDARRGVAMPNARLPLYGAKRGPSCGGRWLLVGPLAWVCSDMVDLLPDPPWSIHERSKWASAAGPDGLPFRYFFVGRDGADGYADLEHADDDSPEAQYEGGFAVATTEERVARGERWVRTTHGPWIRLTELVPAHPPAFHGEDLTAASRTLDFAWVVSDRALVRKGPKPSETAVGTRVRFQVVKIKEERVLDATTGASMVRVSDDGMPDEWLSTKDLARPRAVTDRPEDVGEAERWIDVDLASQTLVAYDGSRPVYATLVSTGRGPQGSDTATPKGTHRIWVKLQTTNMGNLERDDVDDHYSIEDVPYVQFFDKAVALHAAFWHREFGRAHSHGCVNLAPLDARWLFDWTLPHLPAGWSAVFPTSIERGTAVRIR